MRILITGGAGFIGSNLIHHLLHRRDGGHATGAEAPACCPDHERYTSQAEALPEDLEILNLDTLTYAGDLANLEDVDDDPAYTFEKADICQADRVDEIIQGFEPEAIVHLAAESHVDRSIEDGTVFTRTNVVGTQVLLDAVRRHDVGRFLHVSTDEVYGSIEEGSFTEEDPYDPSSPYSASKAASDLLVQAHHTTYGIPVAITRCTNNYGPRQNPEKLIPKMITLALQDEPLPVYGDGSNVRDWIYVKDHCQALVTVLQEAPFEAGIYNVAGQEEHANLEIVHTILDLLDKPRELIEFVTDRPGHDWRYSIDDSKLRGLGWSTTTSFEEGLKETIDAVSTTAPGTSDTAATPTQEASR